MHTIDRLEILIERMAAVAPGQSCAEALREVQRLSRSWRHVGTVKKDRPGHHERNAILNELPEEGAVLRQEIENLLDALKVQLVNDQKIEAYYQVDSLQKRLHG